MNNSSMKKLVLASTSPRRKEILEMVGFSFRTTKSNVIEKFNPRLSPRGQAESLSQQKAEAVAERYKDAIIIASDTVVAIDNESIGKPEDVADAKRLLRKLHGRIHSVYTAFTIIDIATKKTVTKSVQTKVSIRKMTPREIDWYVASGEPMDKAGAYAIQGRGAIFIEKIEGDYFNVVGLPIASLIEELKKFGIYLDK
jgi:septum formation protein